MTVVYVVISHRNPEQVVRLVRVLREGPSSRVLVRHDPRGEKLERERIEAAGGEPLEDRIKVRWGGWSQLRVILACLREAAERHDPDWALILSGQDYPLRPLADIEAGLDASPADARLGSVRRVETRRPAAGDDEFFLRCRYRHYARPRVFPSALLPGSLRPLAYARDLPPLIGVRRTIPAPLTFFASADWLTLGRGGIRAVLAASRHRRLMRHFRRVAIPSESFFASVLLGDPSLIVEQDDRRFASFAPGAAHPDTLTSKDYDRLLASGADFARKFDVTSDSRVLDMLDEHRRARNGR